MLICKICNHPSPAPATYSVKEMMHGKGDLFDYFECDSCGCLQIVEIPANLGEFYIPEAYYSFGNRSSLKQFAIEKRTQFLAGKSPFLGRLFARMFPPETGDHPFFQNISKSSKILEVGCGDGTFARKLFERGYTDITAIDPFMAHAQQREFPFHLRRASLNDLASTCRGRFNAIFFNHSFEHIPTQLETLKLARELLRPDGVCIIRIPFASSYAWEHYRTDWIQLDAPRHLFLHTNDSLKFLAKAAGWNIDSVVHDSYCFQFYGSEQYKLGIALRAPNSWHINAEKSPFTHEQIAEWERQSRELNLQQRGDQITAYLRPA